MTLLLQIRGYRAAGHLQLSDTNKQRLPLLTSLRLDSSLRHSDLGLLLLQAGSQLAQELGFDRGESLLANSSFTALVGLAAMALGAFDMILLPPPCCSCLPSAETSQADLSSAVSQPGSAFGVGGIRVGGRLWSPSKRHAPHIQPHAVAGNCLAGVSGPWDGMEES